MSSSSPSMIPLAEAQPGELAPIRHVLSDLDDTITLDGPLPAAAYGAMEALTRAGKPVVLVTGRPAGWCDLIARLWPVAGVIGENGAFYFRYRPEERRMVRHFQRSAAERRDENRRLMALFEDVRAAVPGATLATDQFSRISDIAIDVCEDVAPLSPAEVDTIIGMLAARGATVKLSSIHINAWFGDFTKLDLAERFLDAELGLDPAAMLEQCLYVGDSPNDEPMFRHFPNSCGVANIARFADQLTYRPRWVTRAPGGLGFAELAGRLTAHS